ncbi:MAG TPA: transcription antitermination factor NusB [Marmoricola sp.]|nr:transcription antitermination factor NusB [Marmoricola sp.]
MAARSKARKRALDLIYAAELRGRSATDALDELIAAGERPSNDYTITLVRGVEEHRARIDALISDYSRDWSLKRMPAVDRNVLRLGIFEVLYADDVPDAVAISEAVNLVRDLSTDESPAFVNGVLATIARDKAALTA